MNINRLTIRGLYGYIDKVIDFKKDITLLVGINGSGKTSVLNIITWLIKPSLPHLCITEFKSVKIDFAFEDINYTIECKHLKSILKYEIKSTKANLDFAPLIVKLNAHPSSLPQDEAYRNDILESYINLKPDEGEVETWNFINSLPSPVIVGLDRNLFTEESDQIFIDERSRTRAYSSKRKTSPLRRVKDIVNTEYRKSKNAILNLTSGLKNHLMLSAFEGNYSIDNLNPSGGVKNKVTIQQIETAEKRVNDYFLKYEKNAFTPKQQEIITNYFSQLKKVTEKYLENSEKIEVKLIYQLNSNQFLKLKRLLKEFEKFESESENVMHRINLFLMAINYFLKDSSKKLLFKEDTSELVFNAIDRKGKVLKEYKDIGNLSSGEQQILILFSYLAFNSQDGKLFIIDEPELSLHVKWQEDFLDALEKITPKGTQIVLATHSPILVGKKKEKAVLLLPYNS